MPNPFTALERTFTLHPAIQVAVFDQRLRLEIEDDNGNVNLLANLVPEITLPEYVQYRSSHKVGDVHYLLTASAWNLDPVIELTILPVFGDTGTSAPQVNIPDLHVSTPDRHGFRLFAPTSRNPAAAQGQCMRPTRLQWNLESGEIAQQFTDVKDFESTEHAWSQQNKTGVGGYFSFDHHAERNPLSYWHREVDGCASQPAHYLNPDGSIAVDEEFPGLILSASGWAEEHCDGFRTVYWIQHTQSPIWRDRGALDQFGQHWTNGDFEHLSWDALAQAYLAHRDAVHGQLLEFKAETYRFMIPHKKEGTPHDEPRAGRARARIVKTAVNLWCALQAMARQPGLVAERKAQIERRAAMLLDRLLTRIRAQVAAWKRQELEREDPWILTGKSGGPRYYSPGEHALYASSLAMLADTMASFGLEELPELRWIRQRVTAWVVDQFALVEEGEWSEAQIALDAIGDGPGMSWELPYTVSPDGERSGPSSGWIFAVEAIRLATIDIERGLDAYLSEAQRAKVFDIWPNLFSRRGAADWQSPDFAGLMQPRKPQPRAAFLYAFRHFPLVG